MVSFSKINVGSRSSPLAKLQVDEVESLLKSQKIHLDFERVYFKTTGDQDKKSSLISGVADNFFTDSLDRALLNKKIDIAVHSAKDLPQTLHPQLKIFALTKSCDDTDAFVGHVPFKKLKKGARIGTSSILRKKSLLELNPSLKIVDIRGTIEERINLFKQGQCDGLIVATAALKRLSLEKHIKNIMPWEGTPLQGQLAIVGRKNDEELNNIFLKIDVRRNYGRVLLVGAGPGAPDLITYRGIKALREADCVFYDYLVDPSLLDFALQAEKVYAGKRKGNHALSQAKLSQMLKDKALQGKTVVRLKGGDPLVFGRGADEITYLKAYHIPVEVIPGVSSATAIPSNLSIPLTARGVSSSVAFISGHGEEESKKNKHLIHIPQADTLIFLMGLTKLKEIIASLKKSRWKNSTPVVVVSKGTRLDEEIIAGTIQDIEGQVKKAKLEPPALIIAGEVGRFWKKDDERPKAILYTGTNPTKYRYLGKLIHWPMIDITQRKFTAEETKSLLNNLVACDMILLTSRFAVKFLIELLYRAKFDLKTLSTKSVIAIGQDTAQLLRFYGLYPQMVSSEEHSEDLFHMLKTRFDLQGKKVLFPRSGLPNPYLKEHLEESGAKVEEVTMYDNKKPAKKSLPAKNTINKIMFTSPSTVRNFLEDYALIPQEWTILAKGPLTQKSLKEAGYTSEVFLDD
jgi:uroporphyrinogen III methyltransferase/synthase